MDYHLLPIGKNYPQVVNAFIEIPKGSHNKYELDETLGIIKLDRVLHSPLFYPVDYGFIPQTRAGDGDALDVLVITDSPVIPGCLMEVRPIGFLNMADDKGQDDKILAVPASNPHYKNINNLQDVEPHILKEIVHFFEEYKKLEEKTVRVKGWESKKEALTLIKKTLISK